jgi:hypothetical protein
MAQWENSFRCPSCRRRLWIPAWYRRRVTWTALGITIALAALALARNPDGAEVAFRLWFMVLGVSIQLGVSQIILRQGEFPVERYDITFADQRGTSVFAALL